MNIGPIIGKGLVIHIPITLISKLVRPIIMDGPDQTIQNQ